MFNKSKIWIAVCVVFVFALGGITFHSLRSERIFAETDKNFKSINVFGEGIVRVSPDVAYVSLGIREEKTTAKAAQDDVSKKMTDVINAITALGVDKKDIQTSNFSIYPVYNYNTNGRSTIRGYEVNQSINVKVKDLVKVGNVVDVAVTNGVNTDTNISFSLLEPAKAYAEALELATKRASDKAGVLASSVGVKIGKPHTVIEEEIYSNYSVTRNFYAESKQMATYDMDDSMPVESGELEIRAKVSMIYEY